MANPTIVVSIVTIARLSPLIFTCIKYLKQYLSDHHKIIITAPIKLFNMQDKYTLTFIEHAYC